MSVAPRPKVLTVPSVLHCAFRPEVVATIREAYGALGDWPAAGKLPVVYHKCYNIGFFGIENLHPFDSKKYKKVTQRLGSGVC